MSEIMERLRYQQKISVLQREIFKDAADEIESLRAQLAEAKALVLEEAAGYQDDIERYHQRALKAEAMLAAQEGEK